MIEDDGYIFNNICWHMQESGDPSLLHTLLGETGPGGENGWYESRDRHGQLAGYLGDIGRAWQLTERTRPAGNTTPSVGLQLRYLLVITSFNSQAGRLPIELLSTLVEKGVWTTEQGFAHALHIPDYVRRAEALLAMAPLLPRQSIEEAFLAIATVANARTRGSVEASLSVRLLELGNPQRALEYTRSIEDESQRVRGLVALAGRLSRGLIPGFVEIVRELRDPWLRSKSLAAVTALAVDTADTARCSSWLRRSTTMNGRMSPWPGLPIDWVWQVDRKKRCGLLARYKASLPSALR